MGIYMFFIIEKKNRLLHTKILGYALLHQANKPILPKQFLVIWTDMVLFYLRNENIQNIHESKVNYYHV